MDVVVSFAVFLGAMAACLILKISIIAALAAGWAAFMLAAMRRGCRFGALMRVCAGGVKDSLIVVGILLIIGMLTASWRAGGTILFFVYYGMKLITPRLFIVLTFALCSLLSYAIGTSFGVAGTMGVIFMALARSGGANEILTAGAVMSGIYFGDCCSPAASSMALTASLCHTEAYAHSRRLLRANLLPMAVCFVLYGAISVLFPPQQVNTQLMTAIKSEFNVSPWVAVPAVLMLLLPILKVKTRIAMLLSVAAAGVTSVLLQGMGVWDFLKCLFAGYKYSSPALGSILQGGGIVSMLQVCAILAISSTYSGIFRVSGMLDGVRDLLSARMLRWGAFPVMFVSGIVFGVVFCNQTIAILMCASILGPSYEKLGLSGERLALDIGCTAVDLCGLIPWCIACSVPLGIMGVGVSALPFSFLLYLLPLCSLIKDRREAKIKAG
jgi:NhaC family Na+:H+ antiporter